MALVNPIVTVTIIHISLVKTVLRTRFRHFNVTSVVLVKVAVTELTKVNEEFRNIGSPVPAKVIHIRALTFVLNKVVVGDTLPLTTMGIIRAVVTTVSSRRTVNMTSRLNPGWLPMPQTTPTGERFFSTQRAYY